LDSTRAFFSFISISVAAPTLITATPPECFAVRSCSFFWSRLQVPVMRLGSRALARLPQP
jgi:hypothetical protein